MSFPAILSSSLPSNLPKKTQSEIRRLPSSSVAGGVSGGVAAIRLPSAPWMTSPLILPAGQNPEISKHKKKVPTADDDDDSHHFLKSGVRGGRSQVAMRKIFKGISRLRKTLPPPPESNAFPEEGSELVDFTIPLNALDAMIPENGGEIPRKRLPWVAAKEEKLFLPKLKKKRVLTKAEMVLPAVELERHREEAMKIRKWVRGKKAGVTPEVVKGIRQAWRKNELALVKLVDPLRLNMVRAHEIVETKTEGLVVWRKKDVIAVYRGKNIEPITNALPSPTLTCMGQSSSVSNIFISAVTLDGISNQTIIENERAENSIANEVVLKSHRDPGLVDVSLYEREVNRLLDGLGPRFIDWWCHKPLPVDADMLPALVPGFKTPFRLCPPHIRQRLSDDDLTYLRKLARPLPTHFALSKNTKLQGLACSIVKLWEKSLIAKIAIKVGVQNTNNQQMAKELKRLTGGILILRNKFLIILFRGKDFLPCKVADSVLERESQVNHQQLVEEQARSRVAETFHWSITSETSSGTIGTLREFKDIQAKYTPGNEFCNGNIPIAAEMEKIRNSIREHEQSLFTLKVKIEKSDKILSKLNTSWSPAFNVDRELLTEEEKESLRRIGLKMDKMLLLGRRGIYDGVIESIHQHWKHREVVKVITVQKQFQQITHTARLLEIESGGTVVAVEKQGRGHAIIIYRGKNYRRPLVTTENLLTKREAYQRSIEVQRRGSLRFFAKERQEFIRKLKQKLRDLKQRAAGIHTTTNPKHPEDLV